MDGRRFPKYLFTTLPTNDLGLLTRSLPIARELRTLGREVVFCSPAMAPRQLVADAGFENLIPQHSIYDLIDMEQSISGLSKFLVSKPWKKRKQSAFEFLYELVPALPLKSVPKSREVWNMDHAGAIMGMLNEGFVRANCEAFRQLMKSCRADVIVDFWNPFAVIAARASRKPVITVIQANAHPKSDGFIWWKPLPPDIPTPVNVVNRVLKDYGLGCIGSLAELSVGDLTLVVGTPETDPLPDGVEVEHIGAVLWQNEGVRLPTWIDGISRDQPLIWVYSGNPRYSSSGDLLDSEIVLSACTETLATESVQVVLTTGNHPLPESLLPLPANFRHEPYLPGLLMAERADLLIHHGGYGSCQTALYAGKPSVILPTYSERLGNARRIEALGAAEVVEVDYVNGKKQVDIEKLRGAVTRVSSHPSYRASAERLSTHLRMYGGAGRAAQLIEALAERKLSGARDWADGMGTT
jgi:UDP:flavonoid glycosyltransferase YjiC (YdhE family)